VEDDGDGEEVQRHEERAFDYLLRQDQAAGEKKWDDPQDECCRCEEQRECVQVVVETPVQPCTNFQTSGE